ncbi:hypothetical protein BKA69DRAFT_1075343 [Paraphysoderma sedebokerense]|nr:hypothetical protein BKA69DRAFT_1075343 [Paraphysoderma sedebokerense]
MAYNYNYSGQPGAGQSQNPYQQNPYSAPGAPPPSYPSSQPQQQQPQYQNYKPQQPQQPGYPPSSNAGYPPPTSAGYPPATSAGYPPQNPVYGSLPHHGSGTPPRPQIPSAKPPPPGADPALWNYFIAVDQDNSGHITCDELQQALQNGDWTTFNSETVRLMMNLFDRNHSGSITFDEFAALWKFITDWNACFQSFDRDRSGYIDKNELRQALLAFGYNLSESLCDMMIRKYDRHGRNNITFDSFIQACVTVKSLTESFQRYDTNRSGWVTINYETFLELVLANR